MHEDWIYYHSHADEDKLHKIKVDGTEKSKVSDEEFSQYIFDGQLILDDGWIYYIEHNPEKQIFVGKLYKMRTDGSEKQLVIDNLVERININKDYIFYSNVDDDSR